jgi:hypothetical protein
MFACLMVARGSGARGTEAGSESRDGTNPEENVLDGTKLCHEPKVGYPGAEVKRLICHRPS